MIPFAPEFEPAAQNEPDAGSQSVQSVDEALEQIDHILHQMLLLAELSVSDGAVDRENLQQVLERLQAKIDRIADTI